MLLYICYNSVADAHDQGRDIIGPHVSFYFLNQSWANVVLHTIDKCHSNGTVWISLLFFNTNISTVAQCVLCNNRGHRIKHKKTFLRVEVLKLFLFNGVEIWFGPPLFSRLHHCLCCALVTGQAVGLRDEPRRKHRPWPAPYERVLLAPLFLSCMV